jgi:hypothetical protein
MKVGDYIRVDNGCICKVLDYTDISDNDFYVNTDSEYNVIYKSWIVKSSPNIIDLIEIGDLVKLFMEEDVDKEDTNIFEVVAIPNDRKTIGVFTGDFEIEFFPVENLRGIVTKEQFEEIEYKIGE